MSTHTVTVGSIVRAPYRSIRSKTLSTRKAVVSSIYEDGTGESVASILLEDPTPLVLRTAPSTGIIPTKRRHDGKIGPFLVAPNFPLHRTTNEEEEEIDDVPLSSLLPLLPFELLDPNEHLPTDVAPTTTKPVTATTLKERGDTLLRLHDPSAALPYYEGALSLTSTIDLGTTVLLHQNGTPPVVPAEVDCIEVVHDGPGLEIDVTYVPDGGEGTVSDRDVALGVCPEEGDGRSLQGRILLNITRCCLYLSDIDVRHGRSSTRAAVYRRAAVVGSTLVIAIDDLSLPSSLVGDRDGDGLRWTVKARLLRAEAYLGIGKDKRAEVDLRKVLDGDRGCRDARRLLKELERVRHNKRTGDRRLAKEMCCWIDGATNNGGEC